MTSLFCEFHESIKKLRMQLPAEPKSILTLTFAYNLIGLFKDIKYQTGNGFGCKAREYRYCQRQVT